jgi:two-component system LytT family response regulator
MIRAVIVDDEKHASELLALKLRKLGLGVEVLARFNQPEAALEYLSQAQLDLLFLDIEMPRLSGFDLLEGLAQVPFDVIFTTAYDQYAIRAFRYSALNYLLKPVEEAELRAALAQWQQKKIKQLSGTQFQLFKEQYQAPVTVMPTRMALPTQEGHEVVEIAHIVRCEAEGSYSHFYLTDATHLLISRNLRQVEQSLTLYGFVRTHQSHLINPQFLRKIIKQEGGYLLMADGAQVPVSKQKRDWLLATLETLERRP